MPGYRTIPTKDTFDVDEKLGGIVTVKQLAYLILTFFFTYASFIVSGQIFEGSDAVYLPATVFFVCILFTFANLDKWIFLRIRYFVLSNNSALERRPELLRNVRTTEEDKIVTLDGRVIALLKVTPVNFPLLSDEAKEAKISAYEMYLRQLVYPIMHLVQSEPVEIEEYAVDLLKETQSAREKGVQNVDDYAKAHVRFLRDFLRTNRSRSKHHYVVLQVQDPRYRQSGGRAEGTDDFSKLMLWGHALLTEFQPNHFFGGGAIFEKPDNFVLLDLAGLRMVFRNPALIPAECPPRSRRMGPVLQFESQVAMLRFARSREKQYYYGAMDLVSLMRKTFTDMSLREREKEFSLDERRRNVGISGGKTRWAYDEAEKHIAVLSDKLEATGLHVRRVKGEELYTGRHMDMVRASRVRVNPNYLLVDNTYMKVVYATGYPYQVNLGWLNNIVDGREDYDLTMYVYPVSIPEALSTFRGAILKLSTEKKARADFLDPETEQHLEDVKSFFTQVVSGKEKYFLSSLYITCNAPSRKSLDTVLEKCKSDLAGASIDYEVADFDMARAVYTTRLSGNDLLAKKREFPSSSLAATFPHISSSVEIDPKGIFFAFDWMAAPIIIDLTKLPNQHIAITGESGSGKSYFAKSLIPRYLLGGYRVFVTDPDGEYVELARHFGGTVSTVGPKFSTIINPFNLEGREINDKIRSLLGLFAIMAGRLNKYQEGLLSDMLGELLEEASRKEKEVTFSDFYKLLSLRLARAKDEQMRHDLQFLQISVRPFIKGGLYGFIDQKTNVKLGAHMHVFDLREYQNDRTLRDFFNYLIFDYITHSLFSDKTLKALFMDEGWTMVNYPSSEDYVRYIIKDSRKYNVSFVFLTQELEDMLQSQAGRSILNNTSTQFTFHQKESAMNLMKTTLNLTREEYEKLSACGIGEGLMISDRCRLLFRVKTNAAEHGIISTNPNEAIAERGRIRPLALTKPGHAKVAITASASIAQTGEGAAVKPATERPAGAAPARPESRRLVAREPAPTGWEETAGGAEAGAKAGNADGQPMDEKSKSEHEKTDEHLMDATGEEKTPKPARGAAEAGGARTAAPEMDNAPLPIALSHGLVKPAEARKLMESMARLEKKNRRMGLKTRGALTASRLEEAGRGPEENPRAAAVARRPVRLARHPSRPAARRPARRKPAAKKQASRRAARRKNKPAERVRPANARKVVARKSAAALKKAGAARAKAGGGREKAGTSGGFSITFTEPAPVQKK